jgi:hypothetical protein
MEKNNTHNARSEDVTQINDFGNGNDLEQEEDYGFKFSSIALESSS